MSHWRKFLTAALAALALTGCGSQVALKDPTIPDPLIVPVSLAVGVRYPEAFDHFVHEEQVIGKEKWLIDLGQSNKMLFNKLFGSMFQSVQVVTADVDPATLPIDALIEPTIDAFEFSVPEQSQTDAFAVWIRYRIKIYDKAGTQVANWPISAYGKSQTAMFDGDDALRRAAVLAMRDAAALIILQMDKTTGISSLANASSAMPGTSEPAVRTTASEEMSDDSG
jgi:hypothetical protein